MENISFQTQDKGCGFASVRTALAGLSKKRRYLYAPEPRIGPQAPSLAEIMAYAGDYGLTLAAFKAKSPEEILANRNFPLLINLLEDGHLHMVVLQRKRGRRFLLLDPIRGRRVLSGSELVALFEGSYLSVEGFQEKGEGVPKAKPCFHRGHTALSILLSLFPAPLLLLGFVFLSSSTLSFLMATGAAFLLSGLGRLHRLYLNREFDAHYSPHLLHPSPKRRQELYLHYHAYKRLRFASIPGGAFLVAEVVSLTVFFCLSDWTLGLAIMSASLFIMVDFLVEYPFIEARERKVEEAERLFLSESGNTQHIAGDLSRLLHLGASHGDHLCIRDFVLTALMVGLGVVFALSNGPFSLTRLIFYVLSLLFIAKEVDKTLVFFSKNEQRAKEEAYFRGHFLER